MKMEASRVGTSRRDVRTDGWASRPTWTERMKNEETMTARRHSAAKLQRNQFIRKAGRQEFFEFSWFPAFIIQKSLRSFAAKVSGKRWPSWSAAVLHRFYRRACRCIPTVQSARGLAQSKTWRSFACAIPVRDRIRVYPCSSVVEASRFILAFNVYLCLIKRT